MSLLRLCKTSSILSAAFLFFSSLIITVVCQSEERGCGDEGDIRLVNGRSALEGRVEICFGNQWGTVCDDRWGDSDASVVCRQLGYLAEDARARNEAYFGEGSGLIHLDDVTCDGSEKRLLDCTRKTRQHDCGHYEDAGVQCQPNIPQSVRTTPTDTSVLITWQPPSVTLPDHFNITLTYTSNSSFSNQTHTSTIQVLGTATMLGYDRLVAQQEYAYCVSAIYGPQMSSFCSTFQTESQHTSESGSTNSPVVGILSFLIILLAFLLVLAGAGLAYPRCIRSRMKDKKYLSNISNFLDEKIYVSNNSAYCQRPQPALRETAQTAANYEAPTRLYDTVHDPPPPPSSTQVVAAAVTTHPYEVLEQPQNDANLAANHYEMAERGGGVPGSTETENAAAPYSQLVHK